MPFKSKAQMRKFYAMEARGEIPKGTTERWKRHTKSISKLPERKRKKKKKKASYDLLVQLEDFIKTADAYSLHSFIPGVGFPPVEEVKPIDTANQHTRPFIDLLRSIKKKMQPMKPYNPKTLVQGMRRATGPRKLRTDGEGTY